MTDEEKKAADAKALADAEAAKGGAMETTEVDPLAEKDKEIARLIEERDNYKTVALKRKGKLPGDESFFNDDTSELSVAEQVKLELLNREIENERKAKEVEMLKIIRENNELKLLIKNRPEGSIGSGGGGAVEVKDNVFSAEQIAKLKETAKRLNADPEKFVENAKKNLRNKQ